MRPAQTIALVARREFLTRVRTRTFLVSNAVILVAILAGIIAASLLTGGTSSSDTVGLVGAADSLSAPLKAAGMDVSTPDEPTARSKVDSGALDVALLPAPGTGYTALVKKDLPTELQQTLIAVVRQQAIAAALEAKGVDPAILTQAAQSAKVQVQATEPPNPAAAQRTGLAYVAIVLMFFQILMFGLYVAIGVVEEKASRVVEVLLATIKPLHLLWGKVLGIGLVGLVQLTAYGVVGLAAGLGTGLVTVTGTAVGVFASVLVWFVLGFAFYAVLYAAAGSLVSRQEDVNSAATPITVVIVVSYLLAQSTLRNPDATLVAVMSWVPPFSAMLMPLRVAAATTNPLQIVGSAVLMLAVTVALALLAAKVYQQSVLHTGTRLSWKAALRARA